MGIKGKKVEGENTWGEEQNWIWVFEIPRLEIEKGGGCCGYLSHSHGGIRNPTCFLELVA